MIENYKRAGLLLKLSIFLNILSAVYLNRTYLSGEDTLILIAIMAVVYVFAHMVQQGNRWTRSLVLIYVVVSLFFAAFDIFLVTITFTAEPFGISLLKGAAAIVPFSMVAWAAFLVTRKSLKKEYEESVILTSDSTNKPER